MKRFTLVFVIAALAWLGCGKDEAKSPEQATKAAPAQPDQAQPAQAQPAQVKPPQPGAAPGQPGAPAGGDPMAEAKQLFATVCATCHGPTGRGDGMAAASLNPKPRNHSDKAWQASVTDERIADVIVKGGPGVGLSPMMPANPQLANKPEVVAALVKLIRSFAAE